MSFWAFVANAAPFWKHHKHPEFPPPEQKPDFTWKWQASWDWEIQTTVTWDEPPFTLPNLPNATTFETTFETTFDTTITLWKKDGEPTNTAIAAVRATKTEEIPEQYITDRPDIFYNYGAYLDGFQNPQDAISLARKVSSNIAYAKATPTYDAKLVLSSLYQNVPQPTKFSNGQLIDDLKNGHSAVDRLMSSIIRPFLRA